MLVHVQTTLENVAKATSRGADAAAGEVASAALPAGRASSSKSSARAPQVPAAKAAARGSGGDREDADVDVGHAREE